MNRQEYLNALENELRKMPKAELSKVLEYYSEYFDEAGLENEQAAIEELGEPQMIASQIFTETAIKSMEEPVKSVKGGLNTIWLIILAIFASPVALPLIFAGVIVVAFLTFAALMLFLSFVLVSVAFIASGLCSFIVGFVLLFSQFASAIANIGTGFIMLAIGILTAIASMKTGIWMFNWIVRLFNKLFQKGAVK